MSAISVDRRSLLAGLAGLGGLALLAASGGRGGMPAAAAEPSTVFAAASLTDVMEELGRQWRQRPGGDVRFSFAASSILARQIEAGAPAAIFASADQAWMDHLAARGLILEATRVSPIGNRLVLIAAKGSPIGAIDLRPGFPLAALLGAGRLAIGDPAHVPVGRYGEEALTALGVWADAEPRLARTENVRAALALVARGEAPLGIVYATDAAATTAVRVIAQFPEATHRPITYPMAICAGHDGPATRALFAFLTGRDAQPIYRRYGFTVP